MDIKKKNRPKNIELNLPILYTPSINGGQEYSDENALNALRHLDNQILPCLNVALNISRSLLMNDETKKGTVSIGYLIGYNENDNTMRVGIYNKYTDFVNANKNSMAVSLKVIARDNDITKFAGFDCVLTNLAVGTVS